jgi:hypothetical protein
MIPDLYHQIHHGVWFDDAYILLNNIYIYKLGQSWTYFICDKAIVILKKGGCTSFKINSFYLNILLFALQENDHILW